MEIVITTSATDHQQGGQAVKRALDGLKLSYSVEFLGDERVFGGNGSTITHTCRLSGLPAGEQTPESSKEYWLNKLSSGTASVEAVQGCATGFVTDPLESAINSTLSAIRDERESGKALSINDHDNREGVLSILGGHLVRLLELQVTQLNEQTVIERSQAGDITHTELTTGRQ